MKSFKAIICVLTVCTLLTGCVSQTNLKDLIIVEGIGIDKSSGSETVLTVQSLNVAMSTGTETPQGNMTVNTSEVGESVLDAVSNLSEAVSRNLFFGHNRIIVLSRELCENDFSSVIDFFLRSSVSRADMAVAVSDGNASQIMQNSEDDSRVPVENVVNMIYNGQETGSSAYITIEDVLNAYSDKTNDIFLPVIKERADDDNSELSGIAIFNDEKLSYVLDEEETAGFALIFGKFKNRYLNLTDEKLGQISVELSSVNVKKSVESAEDGLIFKVVISGKIIVDSIENGTSSTLGSDDMEKICTLAQNKVNELCQKAFYACRFYEFVCLRLGQ